MCYEQTQSDSERERVKCARRVDPLLLAKSFGQSVPAQSSTASLIVGVRQMNCVACGCCRRRRFNRGRKGEEERIDPHTVGFGLGVAVDNKNDDDGTRNERERGGKMGESARVHLYM